MSCAAVGDDTAAQGFPFVIKYKSEYGIQSGIITDAWVQISILTFGIPFILVLYRTGSSDCVILDF